MESINDYQEREPRRQTAFGRWGQTILGHFPFHAGVALLQSLSFLPGAACIYLYGRLGGAVFMMAGWLLLGLTGPVYAAMQKMTWQEQFDFPCYLYREFFQEVKKNFRQGYCMGLLFTALWGLVLAPLVIAEMSKISLPVWAVIVMLAAACLLVLVIFGYVQLYEATSQAGDLADQLESLTQENQLLHSEYEGKIDLAAIEERATRDLGMTQPTSSQTVYLNLAGSDRAEVLQEESSNPLTAVVNALKSSMESLVSYLS